MLSDFSYYQLDLLEPRLKYLTNIKDIVHPKYVSSLFSEDYNERENIRITYSERDDDMNDDSKDDRNDFKNPLMMREMNYSNDKSNNLSYE